MTLHLIGFAEIGIYLREQREALGVEALDAARALRLRPPYITALEAGDMDAMPGITYARGYLISYADYLRLDKTMLLTAFDEACQFRPQSIFQPEPMRKGARPPLGLLFLCVIVLLLVVIAWHSVRLHGVFAPTEKTHENLQDGPAIAAPAAPVKVMEPRQLGRACLTIMPVGEQPLVCWWRYLPEGALGMQPRMRYSSELRFPTYLILER